MTTQESRNAVLVRAAIEARTPSEAQAVQDLIFEAVGSRFERPVGDKYNNQGLLTGSGASFDHKCLEDVTNMQDGVLERAALVKWGRLDAAPYSDPQSAVQDLFGHMSVKEQANLASVTIDSAGVESGRKRVTLVMRDQGCGLTPAAVPLTIFQIGASHKDGVAWQQGKFGLGGATTYRAAKAIVLVTRRAPELLNPGEEDRIAVSVVQWERVRTTTNAYYLVASRWERAGDDAPAFSVPARDFPDFDPGVHLALISYDTQALARRSGDEKSFDTIFNTRLYRPVLPITYRNNTSRDRTETLAGLERRLDDNPAPADMEGKAVLPLRLGGTTYHLPVRFRIFAKPGDKGERRNYVAHGHALALTSNGQVHAHWTPQEFKARTRLNKVAERVFVVVESDALPIELRTELFTADRAQLVRSSTALRLEAEVASFIGDLSQLRDANAALIREAITGDNNGRPTIEIARKIARALKVKGFALGGEGARGGGSVVPPPTQPDDLYTDPTHFEGPDHVEAVIGHTKGVYLRLNAKDGFLGEGGRAILRVTCDHPEIRPEDITVGSLSAGRVRISIAVPETDVLGTFEMTSVVEPWIRSSGGLGPQFEWTTKLELVTEPTARRQSSTNGGGSAKGKSGGSDGDLVALIWKSDTERDDWTSVTVGDIEMVAGTDLAGERDEYADLASISEKIPTIILNRTYAPLKAYVQARAAELTDEGKEQARERYAVGAGVALILLDRQRTVDEKAGLVTADAAFTAGAQAAARGILSVLPEYDRLARELEE